MKRTLLCLLAMAALVASGTVTSTLMAQGAVAQPAANPQQPQAAAPVNPIVVVDYMYLMMVHPKLHADTSVLAESKKQAVGKLQGEQQQFLAMQRELETLTVGTPDYTRKKEELRRADLDFQLRVSKMNEDFELTALQYNYNAYMEIKNMVDVYAKQNNFVVVINYMDVMRRLPKEKSPETMNAEMSQIDMPVIWRNPNFDITPAIEGWLNNTYKGKYDVVNFEQLKEQRFAKPQQQTSVATGPGGQSPVSPR